MDWKSAIARNRTALAIIVASLFTLLGLERGGSAGAVSPAVRRAVLRLLLPAESAARRLIVMAARGLGGMPVPARFKPFSAIAAGSGAKGAGVKWPAFRLFDRRKRFGRARAPAPRFVPRIRFFSDPPAALAAFRPVPQAPAPAADPALLAAQRLSGRLHALDGALRNLPRQARRLARRQAGDRTRPRGGTRPVLRPGFPPGHRRKPATAADEVLADCHALALAARADTS